jgi:hypothetical protein
MAFYRLALFGLSFVLNRLFSIITVWQMAPRCARAASFCLLIFGVHNPSAERYLVADMVGLVACMLMMTGTTRPTLLAIHMQVVEIKTAIAKAGMHASLNLD